MPGDISARAAAGGDTGSPGAVVLGGSEWGTASLGSWGVPRNSPVPWCFA